MKKLDIRRAMREHHTTIAAVCERTGQKAPNIVSIMDGNPTVAKLTQVAEGIGCDITDLFYNDNDDDRSALPLGSSKNDNKAGASEGADLFSQTAEQGKAEAQPVQTIAFCPHCGAKVQVGVVLMPAK